MAFNTNVDWVGRDSRRAQWICEAGRHTVTISDWEYLPSGGPKRFVAFEVKDDHGRKLYVTFSLSDRLLWNDRLRSFFGAANGWDPAQNQGSSHTFAKAKQFNSLIGARIRVHVIKADNGLHQVLDWAAVPNATESGSAGST